MSKLAKRKSAAGQAPLWQRRFFTLRGDLLCFYNSEADVASGPPKWSLDLGVKGATASPYVDPSGPDATRIELIAGDEHFSFRADSEVEAEMWSAALPTKPRNGNGHGSAIPSGAGGGMFDGMMTGPPPPSCATDVGLQPPSMPAAAASAFDFMSCASVGGGVAPPLPCQTTPAEAPPPTQPGGAIASTSMRSTGLPGASVAPPPSSSGLTDWASATGDKAAVRKKKVVRKAKQPGMAGDAADGNGDGSVAVAVASARGADAALDGYGMPPAVPGAQAAGSKDLDGVAAAGGVGSFGGGMFDGLAFSSPPSVTRNRQ